MTPFASGIWRAAGSWLCCPLDDPSSKPTTNYSSPVRAVACYSRSIKLNPEYARSWNDRGVAYWWLGQKDKALVDYSQAIKLHPTESVHWYNRGLVYGHFGQYEKAIADYSRAIELKSQNPDIWKDRAECYAESGRWKEATADYARAVGVNKDAVNPWNSQALTCVQQGDGAGYRKLCTDMLEQFGSSKKPEAAYLTVWTCVLAADAVASWKAPLQLAEKAVADNPKDYRALNRHGAALYRAGQYREALKRLTEAEAAYRPADEKLHAIAYNWLFLAMAQQRLGHVEEAGKWYAKATQGIDREMPKRPEGPVASPSHWNRRLTLQLLRREVEELLSKNAH